MVDINGERLLADLKQLRTFGAKGSGVVRPSFSPVDMQARAWLRDRMLAAGLESSIDSVGNVVGRSPNPGPTVVLGSHSDTQPTGGWLDGALGVIYALESARALLESPEHRELSVDALAFIDEEGTYTSCLGAKSFCDVVTAADLAAANASGETVAEAITRTKVGTNPQYRLDPDRHIAYLEAHIEQGPRLEAENLRIGVVTSIVGIRSAMITFDGQQNHAGTTPMVLRKDAGVAMFEFAVELRRRFADLAGDATVWTFGNGGLSPGAESIIPGSAWLRLQFRDQNENRLEAMATCAANLADELTETGPVTMTVEFDREAIAPTQMDESLLAHIDAAAERHVPGSWTRMPSGAGHDPMVISHHLPCAMLFIPSINGISHDFAEDSHEADIVTGCQVFADATASILRG